MKTIYRFLKIIVRLSFRLYYPRTTVLHAERLQFDEPCILISNHPNTLVDPLQVASRANKLVYFLANAGLYANPVAGKLLRTFFTIPIRRRSDNPNANVSNADSFKACIDFLTEGGCLWIAPEGGSDMYRRLRPIKTGTARIALATEAANDFQLRLRIQPVGLTYERPNFFDTGLVVHAGEPIYAKDWQAEFEQDEFRAAKKLTAFIAERMRSLLIDTQDEAEERLLLQLESLNRSQRELSELEIYQRSHNMLSALRKMAAEERAALQSKLDVYFEMLEEQQLSDAVILDYQKGRGVGGPLLKVVLGFPLFLYGFLNNALPVLIVLGIVRKLNLYVGYNSTVKIVGGLFFFTVFYALQGWLLYSWLESWWLLLLYWATLVPAGLFAWRYKNWWQQMLRLMRLRQSIFETLWRKREELMQLLQGKT